MTTENIAGLYRQLSLPKSEGSGFSQSPVEKAKGNIRVEQFTGEGYVVSQQVKLEPEKDPFVPELVANPLRQGDVIPNDSVYGIFNTGNQPLSITLAHEDPDEKSDPSEDAPLAYHVVPNQDGRPSLAKNPGFKGEVRIVFDRTRTDPNLPSRFK